MSKDETVLRQIDNDRMQDQAKEAYEAVGAAIAPHMADSYEETVENIIGRQIGLSMAMTANIMALNEASFISEAEKELASNINMDMIEVIHGALLREFGLKTLDQLTPDTQETVH